MTTMKNKLIKGAHFTDIHFGRKANSQQHNEDCVKFIEWFYSEVKKDPDIDHIIFLGDWNENRSSLNISTMNYSYRAAKLLNNLNLPIFFLVGNHDLYHRHTREIHSIIPFSEFSNFRVIDEPTVVKEIGLSGGLLCPYLFHDEYTNLAQHLNVPFWAGHFEFKDFEVTGYGMKMPTGPDASNFKGPQIISGHFHKRQIRDNVTFIGNTFPMDFGDAGSNERGMMIYDHTIRQMIFKDWNDSPKYVKTSLSDILDKKVKLSSNMRVKCVVDIPITFEESSVIRQQFMKQFELREFTLEESLEINQALSETDANIDWEDIRLVSVHELVHEMLKNVNTDNISSNKLIDIYLNLPTKIEKEKGNEY